jgi:hypothetical protein
MRLESSFLVGLVIFGLRNRSSDAFLAHPSAPLGLSTELGQLAEQVLEYSDFLPHPNTEFNAQDVVNVCMTAMVQKKDEGLEVCFNFSSDRCRAAQGGSLEKFNEYARNPVFGFLVKCVDWKVISVGSIIPGTPTRGAMQTVLIDAKQPPKPTTENSDAKRFLWTLQQERRPPREGCWVIHEVLYVKNAFALTL